MTGNEKPAFPPSSAAADNFIENVVKSAAPRNLVNFKLNTSNIIQGDASKVKTSLEEYLNLSRIVPTMKFPDISQTINSLYSEKLDNLVSFNTQSLCFGAALGAAVSAGVAVGMISVASLMSSLGYVPSWWNHMYRKMKEVLRPFVFPPGGDANAGGENSKESKGSTQKLRIIQGKPLSCSFSDEKFFAGAEQSRQCLDSITVSLSKQRLVWDNVLRISVHLVVGHCDAEEFRSILREYPINENICTVSVLYVQQLEDRRDCVQVEAMLQCP